MKFLLSLKKLGCFFQAPLLLVIRLYWGYQFAIAGYGKFLDLEKVTSFFTSLGIPFPDINAICVAGVEFGCGLLLLIGLFSRLAAIPLIVVMSVAYLTTEQAALEALFFAFDPSLFFQATPFLFSYASLVVFCFGPGKISCDYLIQKELP